MLPSNLLLTKKRRNTIEPIYAQLTKDNIHVADLLIQIYKQHVGKKKGELDRVIEDLEELGYGYRFIRGLTTLLDRKIRSTVVTPIASSKIRRTVFSLTQKIGLPTKPKSRVNIINNAAQLLNLPSDKIEEYLYADLEEQKIIENFEEITSLDLLKWYNLSLTQTLLFCATELVFTTTGNWQKIFRKIKWLGLIYSVRQIEDNYIVTVDGPASLFKLNRKYGTKLAKLLPSIISNNNWKITAKILRYRNDTCLLNLDLNSTKHNELLMRYQDSQTIFDSSVEKNFANRFKALNTGWKLEREPEPIPVGKWVMIPDFTLQKGKMKMYLEVAGFWTAKYIEHKIKKLSLLHTDNFIVAVNQKLACQKLRALQDKLEIIYYKKYIPLKPLLIILERKEEEYVKKEVEELSIEMFSNLQGSPILFSELAKDFNILEESLKRFLENKQISGYVNLDEFLINEAHLDRIKRKLCNQLKKRDVSYTEAVRTIEESGAKKPIIILEALNFGVKWSGINPDSAKIYKK
jgi:predicted nuclease of restriction endonuclease-like RecB superfamily